ncbi:hypothetical protein PRUPE_7G095500 [Prunus persica]|uniref:C3H1-type domain-containing protein n=1 Tax=Prunus persica TaxID=3760 RepID=A0A251N9A3_PRUPE|nr:hypothetical protein PRUPE_7G095500 [Prunus persica]
MAEQNLVDEYQCDIKRLKKNRAKTAEKNQRQLQILQEENEKLSKMVDSYSKGMQKQLEALENPKKRKRDHETSFAQAKKVIFGSSSDEPQEVLNRCNSTSLPSQRKASKLDGKLYFSSGLSKSSTPDSNPDICKDYKDTGYCGYGDSCKFMHDRGDYKSGWQMEREQRKMMMMMMMRMARCHLHVSSAGNHYPVVTKCNHYFCEHCTLKHHSKNKKCFVCNKPTLGIFSTVYEIRRRMAA